MVGVFKGSTEITDFKLGSVQVAEVYVGATKVWPTASPNAILYCDQRDTLIGYIEPFDSYPQVGTMTPEELEINGVMRATEYLYSWPDEGSAYLGVAVDISGQPAVDVRLIKVSDQSELYSPKGSKTWDIFDGVSYIDLPEMYNQLVVNETYEVWIE